MVNFRITIENFSIDELITKITEFLSPLEKTRCKSPNSQAKKLGATQVKIKPFVQN